MANEQQNMEINSLLTTNVIITNPDGTLECNVYGEMAKFVGTVKIINQKNKK